MEAFWELGGARVGFTRCRPANYADSTRPSHPNYGLNTEDESELVLDDRRALARRLGTSIAWMTQTHSDIVCEISAADVPVDNAVTADAVIASRVGVAVQVADCIPVLVVDPRKRKVAAIHAGRAGVEKNIVGKTLDRLYATGSLRGELLAAVGPSICGHCYEVPPTMWDRFTTQYPVGASHTRWGTPALDLRAVVDQQLRSGWIDDIRCDNTCTYEHDDLNSYRRNPHCGRQAGWAYFPAE
ncbi:MAG: polyphenol oxidase family protein [Actinomycetaceae bacterium]|nr:polyphenol oxidase family protein [Actinomycetaceae bacterium]